ncbi:MAG: hypothetical protein GY865_16325 [candidate division Zixibacteria bacterium]|nr:hypothetical protein [candidate division Zixibacteria bacterium]
MRHNITAIFLSLLLILLLSACGTHENTQDEDLMELNSLYSQIENIIGDAASDDPANCRVIGIGAKPCGGHWKYKVYSVQDTDTLLLSAIVELHYQKEKAFNHKWGICSDCMAVGPPRLACEDGHCVPVY